MPAFLLSRIWSKAAIALGRLCCSSAELAMLRIVERCFTVSCRDSRFRRNPKTKSATNARQRALSPARRWRMLDPPAISMGPYYPTVRFKSHFGFQVEVATASYRLGRSPHITRCSNVGNRSGSDGSHATQSYKVQRWRKRGKGTDLRDGRPLRREPGPNGTLGIQSSTAWDL